MADVFETENDCRAYLRFLKKYGERHGLAIRAYCLMTNHIHLGFAVNPKRWTIERSFGWLGRFR